MKKIIAILLPLVLAAMPMASVQRASAAVGDYPYAEGTPFVLPAPAAETQAVLERAELDISVTDVYNGQGLSAETLASYATSASVKYTLFNPTEDDLTLRLVRAAPLPGFLTYHDLDDAEKYSETVGGEEVPAALRYAYYGGWEYGGEYRLLSDTEIPDEFYASDLVCHTHVFDMTSENQNAILKLTLTYNPNRTRIFLGEMYRAGVTDGRCEVYFGGDTEMSFVSAGETPEISACAVAEVGIWGGEETEVAASVEQETQELRFGAYVQASRPEGVGEADWYNAAVRYLKDSANEYGLVYSVPARLDASLLRRMREISLTVPAGERAEAVFTGPVYPDAYRSLYYSFSPAPAWAFTGSERAEFVCTVRADVFGDPTLPFGQEADGTYVYEGPLPLGELAFSGGEIAYEEDIFDIFYRALFIVFLSLPLIAIAAVVIVILVRRHRRKQRNTQ